MSPRRSWRLAASLLSVMVVPVAALPALPASAQAPATAQVVIDAVGTDGIDGLAILGPAADGGTDVQILVSQAPADTFAVVHAGTCDAIDEHQPGDARAGEPCQVGGRQARGRAHGCAGGRGGHVRLSGRRPLAAQAG